MRLNPEVLRDYIPKRVTLCGFALVLMHSLTVSCSIHKDSPLQELSPATITPMAERATQDSKLVILDQEQVEVIDMETNNILSMPFADLYWHEVDLSPDRGISSSGMLAARVLEPDGDLKGLMIQIVNANDGSTLASIPLFSETLVGALFDETDTPLDIDVVNMLLGGWAAPRWSPDGSMLAFMAASEGDSSDAYIFHLDDGSIQHLTHESEQANVIGWSPDSTTVIYAVGKDFERLSYEVLELRSHNLHTGADQRVVEVFGWQGVHIFGWHSDVEVLFSYVDVGNGYYRDLVLGNIETGEVRSLFEGVLEDAAVEPYSSVYALVLNDNPEWGSGIFLGSLYTRDFEQVIDWAGSHWHDLEWVITEDRFTIGSSTGSLLFDSKLMQLDVYDQENCPPLPSPDGAWMLFGACEGAIYQSPLKLYRRWESTPEMQTEETILTQIWQIDSKGVIYFTTEGDVYVQPISGAERQLLWSGSALDIALIAPISVRESVKATQQAAPTLTPKPTSTPTLTPTWAPTATPETPESLPQLTPGQPFLIDEIKMINDRVGWAVTARKTDYGLHPTYHLLRTEDGGDTWWEVTPPELVPPSISGALYLHGTFLDDQHAWVIPHFGIGTKVMNVWRTMDGGVTWQASRLRTRGQSGEGGPKLFFSDRQHGWLFVVYFLGAGSHDVDIFRTEDGGITWESVLLPEYPFSVVRDLDFIDHGTGWLVSGHGAGFVPAFYLEMTNDGGLTWAEVVLESELEPSGLEGFCDIQDPHITDYSHGVVTRRCEVYQEKTIEWRYYLGTTEDAGRTWAYVEIPGTPYRLDDSYLWAMTSLPPSPDPVHKSTTIYRSANGGRSWQEVSQVEWIGELYFSTYRHGWALVEGQLLRTLDGGATWESVDPRLVKPKKASVDATDWVRLEASSDPIEESFVTQLELLAEYEADDPVSLATNNRTLYVGTGRGRVAVWPLARVFPRSLPELRISEGWIYDLDSSFDLPGFWAASGDGQAYQYADLFYDLLVQVPTKHHELSGVAYVDSGVLVSGSEGRIELWDRSDETSWEWALKMTLEGHQGWVWDVDASPNERIYASSGADRTVRLWNAEDGTSLWVLFGHTSTVTKIRFSPDNQSLASASRDGTVRIWDVETGAELAILEGHEDWVMDLAYSPDGSLLASVDADGEIFLWDMTAGTLIRRWRAHQKSARGVVFSQDGSLLITAGDDDRVRLWGIKP